MVNWLYLIEIMLMSCCQGTPLGTWIAHHLLEEGCLLTWKERIPPCLAYFGSKTAKNPFLGLAIPPPMYIDGRARKVSVFNKFSITFCTQGVHLRDIWAALV